MDIYPILASISSETMDFFKQKRYMYSLEVFVYDLHIPFSRCMNDSLAFSFYLCIGVSIILRFSFSFHHISHQETTLTGKSEGWAKTSTTLNLCVNECLHLYRAESKNFKIKDAGKKFLFVAGNFEELIEGKE